VCIHALKVHSVKNQTLQNYYIPHLLYCLYPRSTYCMPRMAQAMANLAGDVQQPVPFFKLQGTAA
jgi:hypothetical protein